jgi:3-(methylthio)propionyl---CoA ligase
MLGLMQPHPLLISSLLRHAARHHASAEIVSKLVDGAIHRCTVRDLAIRARKLANALTALGMKPSDRIGTLAWNSYRHLEIYYGVTGTGAIMHTVNPRLHPDDIAYIVNHAGDSILLIDTTFAPVLAAIAERIAPIVRTIVMLCEPAEMPDLALPPGMQLLCYEDLVEAASDAFDWPVFDENTACILCYTSGTTGRPKGVLYSHRSTMLHALGSNMADVFCLRAVDRVMPVAPMFHVNAWGVPFSAMMAGAAFIMPGRHLDGASVAKMMNEECVTFSSGVPTVWLGLLQHLRASGERLHTAKRLIIGGSACPGLLIEAFDKEYGVRVEHAWGMTETSPIGTFNTAKPGHETWGAAQRHTHMLRQGRAPFGVDMKIVDGEGRELPWDGVAFGDLKVRGPWIAGAYFGDEPGSATDADGWFTTGDVSTIDPDGYMQITDRSKDVIKSGGEWISSIALENIAVSHPDVIEAAVIAARHPKWDERPLLLVVPKPGATVAPDDLIAFYEGKIAKWWMPDAVLVVDELPHTATGKLLKTALRAKYHDYLVTHAAGPPST